MAAVSNLIHETSVSTGTGSFTLSAVDGKQRASDGLGTTDLSTLNPIFFISHQTEPEWEVVRGYMSDANTLVRQAVLNSSNAGALVNFSAGVKDVTNDIPAQFQAAIDRAQTWSGVQTFTPGIRVPDNVGIADDDGNEQVRFQKTASAVNQIDITNAATGNAPSVAATGDDTNIDLNLVSKGTGGVKANNALVKTVGKETIWIPSGALYANPAAAPTSYVFDSGSNNVILRTWSHSATTSTSVEFSIAMPKSWNEGTLTAQFLWTAEGGSAGNVVWGIQGISFSNDDPLNASFGTRVDVTDAWIANGDLHISDETAAITFAGTPGEGDMILFEAMRVGGDGGDTLTVAALLVGIKLHFTSNASTDA